MSTVRISLPERLREEIASYREAASRFLRGELDPREFRSVRVPMGIYEQRRDGSYMMRLRIPAGDITPQQLAAVAREAARYTLGPLHVTTRQDLQIHNLSLDATVALSEAFYPLGLTSRGGGGNTVRNIIADPLSGYHGLFDVVPHAKALTERLIAESDSWTLPRKFKVCFAPGVETPFLALVADVGLIATEREGRRGFMVYVGGGMGAHSKTGILWKEWVPEGEVYAVVRAVKELFDAHGNRRNRHRARLRFLRDAWGDEVFLARLEEYLESVRSRSLPPLEVPPAPPVRGVWREVVLPLGDLTPEQAQALAELVAPFGEDTIRLTHRQNILLRQIPEEEVARVEQRVRELGLKVGPESVWERAVACAGAHTCRLGICLSRNLLVALQRHVGALGAHPQVRDITLNISGCPNACGQTPVADLGFAGAARRIHGRSIPAYVVYAGASLRPGRARLAERLGVVPAARVPDLVAAFFREVSARRRPGESWFEFYEREGRALLTALIPSYGEVPTPEEDLRPYHDWYDPLPFSLLGKVEGECSAGLFDLIEYDLSQAEEALKEGRLAQAVTAASRALLITKGIETREDAAVLDAFLREFVGVHLDPGFGRVLEVVREGGEPDPREVAALVQAVKELYRAMDDSLRLPRLEAAPKASSASTRPSPAGEAPLHDFRGVPCPINFVKAKLVLEPLPPGTEVEFLLDDGQPIENVPASLEGEGHEVVWKRKEGAAWRIHVRKAGL
ncbi:sulfurtransferase TusA family protein [Spirochaeta thermophila]|uniref:Ferredoxin-nitrite reductase n=1 Tax=Winmispira thermophila (strain ATCC 49972 / DSM 6192 / RI 19.B1) TaxID=665571 RepID=E0RN92_WINT6|nr:sulfurtransferase TusA family protein [Spirochaeta thermophila]ADN02561.1 ferredoxin-nitrite reductase [Spirochaeta thermophila DSM 6192]